MRASQWLRRLLLIPAIAFLGAVPLGAQEESPVYRALDLEDAGRWDEAATLYRESLRGPEAVQALFGLERALITLGRGEELSLVLSELVREQPQNELARAMYVRTLLRLERRAAALGVVQQWVRQQPLEPEAYRQLYSIAPLTSAEARVLWRQLRSLSGSDAAGVIMDELADQVLAGGLWNIAREMLEDRYARAPTYETAEQLALAAARAGDVDRVRSVARAADLVEESRALGWLRLYEGDLRGSRHLLARAEEMDAAAVLPLAALARTTAAHSPEFGAGLLRLVRGDTVAAARAFVKAAPGMPGAESLLLAWAARLHVAKGDLRAAAELYDLIANDHSLSPEAPEAVLAQARALARSGRTDAAAARLEHLILAYPSSALVPMARRELDQVRGVVPPA